MKALAQQSRHQCQRFWFGSGTAFLSGLRPKFGGQSQGFIREWKVAPWGSVDESFKPADTESLLRPQKLPLQLVVNNGLVR